MAASNAMGTLAIHFFCRSHPSGGMGGTEIHCGQMEPQRITYQFPDQYPITNKFAKAANLDFGHFGFEQPLGNDSNHFRLISLTHYHLETLTPDQASQVCSRSQTLRQYKADEITRG